MTRQQLFWVTFAYAVAFLAVAYFTRATARRVLGALTGGAVAGAAFLGLYYLGEGTGLWRGSLPHGLGHSILLYFGAAISLSPIYPVTWRIARRFGRRGVMACLLGVAVIGPPRDRLIAAEYPEWIVFAPGVAPLLAIAATYVSVVALGHMVMWLVAGPAAGDRLARRVAAPAGA